MRCKSSYIEVIISDNFYIFNALKDNDPEFISTILVQNDYEEFLKNTAKIDLLITDKVLSPEIVPTYKIRNIVNLSSKPIDNNEIQLSEEIGGLYRLAALIETTSRLRNDKNYFFCSINDSWIYNEKHSCFSSENNIIKFTEKENAIFRTLLLSKDHSFDKNQLRNTIWNYHKNSESTTVDTHLYKMKQRLPDGMMNIKDNICSLTIDNLLL
jgi:ADP-heptose:LPS heptosyltransferase